MNNPLQITQPGKMPVSIPIHIPVFSYLLTTTVTIIYMLYTCPDLFPVVHWGALEALVCLILYLTPNHHTCIILSI